MRKCVTPIIAIVLLSLMTVGAVGVAFFWVSNVQSSISEQAGSSVGSSPGSDCSRLNIVSVRGNKVSVSNVGCDTVENVSVVVDGVLTEYEVSLGPGQATTINLVESMSSGEEHCVTVTLPSGVRSTQCVSSSQATEEAGFGEEEEEGVWYSGCSMGETVVDWDDKTTFSLSDTLSCGCNSTSGINYLTNPGFEDDFTDWTVEDNGETVIINNTIVHNGSKSVYMKSTNPDIGVQPNVYQFVDEAGYIILSVNSSVNDSAGADAFTDVVVSVGEDSPEYRIYYGLFWTPGGTIDSFCNDFIPMGENMYAVCPSESLNDYEWNTVFFHPKEDFKEIFGIDIDDYSVKVITLLVGGTTEAYFDDLYTGPSSEGMYCDSSNDDGVADGVCYNNSCVDTYIRDWSSPNEFFTSEDVFVNVSLVSFASSPSCNLNIDNSDYSMDLTSYSASDTTSPLSRGRYEANVTCTGDNSEMSLARNISSNIIKHNWTNTYSISGLGYKHMAVAEFDGSSPGKEIFIPSYKNETLLLSSSGNILKNFSIYNDYIDMDSEYGAHPSPVRIVDLNNDGYNELIFKTWSNLYVYDKNYDLLVNISDYFNDDVALSIADVNDSSSGLEIVDTDSGNIRIYNSTGGELVDKDYYSCTSRGGTAIKGAVVDDINPNNPGPEVIIGEPRCYWKGIRMFMTNGSYLYNYSLHTSDSMSKWATPAVADVDSSSPGKEIAYPLHDDSGNNYLYLFNSSLSPLWNYSYSGSDYYPHSPIIGDVDGDADLEIIFYTEDNSGSSNHKLWVFDKDGNVILEYDGFSGDIRPLLSEIDSGNPGLEIMSGGSEGLKVLNSTGYDLYTSTMSVGPNIVTTDIDNDGYIEIIAASGGSVNCFETLSTETSKIWPTFHQNNNNTGYLS